MSKKYQRVLLCFSYSFTIFFPFTFAVASELATANNNTKQVLQLEPSELLKKTDAPRGATENGISWTSVVKSGASEKKYLVKVKGVNALAECLEPARCLGESILFNDLSLWYYKQGLKKPVPISGKQKLSGQAANGDIAATNYARDYIATYAIKKEVVLLSTVFYSNLPCVVLLLQAKSKSVTYDKIKYWVCEKEDFIFAAKSEFQTSEGVPLKVAEFEYENSLNSKNLADKNSSKVSQFVSVMRIQDSLATSQKTDIVYSNVKLESHPLSIFQSSNFLR